MKPKVTIGICVRNSAATIRDTIESIIAQDYPHELMEIIFVDDGSKDETLSIIKRFISKLKIRARVYSHEWRGLGFSRNVVLDNAKGEFILWVDGDMMLPKDHVRKQVEFMEKNPHVGVGKAKCRFVGKNSLIVFLENLAFEVYDMKNSLDLRLPGTGGAIFRSQAVSEVGGFDENLKGVGEDQDLVYRIKNKGWCIEKTPTIFYERRNGSWLNFWRKCFSYGYGNFYLFRKNRNILSLLRMNPLASFFAGVLYIKDAYKLFHSKLTFFLPIHFFFKLMCWCLGFAQAQFKSSSFSFFK